METFLSTDMVDVHAREDFWREIIKPVYDVISVGDAQEEGFSGYVKSRPFGTLILGSTRFNGQNYQRTTKVIAQGGLDHYFLQVLLAGGIRSDCNGVNARAEPGDVMIFDLTQVISSRAEAGARISVVIPRTELAQRVGWRNLHGMVLSGRNPAVGVLINYMKGVSGTAGLLNPHETVAAQEAMMILLAACINGVENTLPELPVNQPMRKRILDYIDEGLTNPLLGPHSIMQHFRVSRSHLYRTFEIDGGVARIIRDKRLDLAYRWLIDRSRRPLSLKEIAYRCGFRDGPQFSKLFKARFGMSAKEARAMAIPLPERTDLVDFQRHLSDQANRLGG